MPTSFRSRLLTPIAPLAVLLLAMAPIAGAQAAIDPVIQKLGEYVASYGAKASVIVAVEKYTQSVTTAQSGPTRPRQILAEFAIVKAGSGWVGYRDVVAVNGQEVTDRRDRLRRLLTEPDADTSEIARIANESARYNIGPVATNLNVPTTALFFFQPSNLHRFAFTRKSTKKIDGTGTVEFDFRETASPSMVMTRDGRDVPLEGTLWVVPADGTVVRSRLRIRGFADTTTTNVQQAPAARPPVDPTRPTGGREALGASGYADPLDVRDIRSVAEIDVTYARVTELDLWLPAKMVEQYEGGIKLGDRPPFLGVSTTRATYSDFKQFGAATVLTIPKFP